MHLLVMWGFALAMVPLSLAVLWELVVLARATILNNSSVKPTPSLPTGERTLSERQ